VYFWQDNALQLIQKYQLNPLRAARILAQLHSSLNNGAGKFGAAKSHCRGVLLDRIGARLLDHFFPLEVEGRLMAIAELRRGVAEACDAEARMGNEIAATALATSRVDGAFPPRRIRPNPDPKVGAWKPTAPVFMNTPVEPFAGDWRMYFASSAAEFHLAPPLDPQSNAYREATLEVAAVVQNLSLENRKSAEYWHLEAGSVTPPGVWNQRLRQLIKENNAKVDETRLFAVFNMALYDAMVACWHYKYAFWTERPITAAERLGLGPFTPPLVTPPFPSYPSGHSSVSGAAAVVIGSYLPGLAGEAERLAMEASMSRLWGGIHFRFDNDRGLQLGRLVGEVAVKAMPPADTKPNR